ncbi:addiction module antitoxin, RelB DinJ family [Levilactobacillus namurensis DSM 19117]|uniref:Addiction module antitoxin, RelB DinJ family n=1 Tax=Levilactobacillus namurensis DSM 19117 TaxID=1423773 RepID=A0A0R1JZ67_9LACO|nr:type II toxin-antitoxin system RelB/DinJ family antitoxin [Levilactobacillus namurensis]KRK76469.1 addiction module antitoxin, RelB DinJ family [Levilactobacillus namurensis DSM 19117]GEO74017.1 DNA-damage-inducible protein J [Levilactobacillus namurensis]
METTPTTIRLDGELKKELNKELKSMGLSINEYFNLAAHQLVIQKKVPFEVLAASDEPTETTEKALVAAQAKSLGIIPDDAPSFDNVDDLKHYLDKE